jgi:hypothetical protein
MSYRDQTDTSGPRKGKPVDFGAAVVLGLCFGFTLGLIVDNIGMGLATGLSLATLVNAYGEKKQNERNAGVAFAIGLGGFLVVLLLWIVTGLGWL